eukprot:TRINITY_DN22317_c0_g2_i1.p1 TRINITY_DN22317_c0_g2~~TRINITY_DN22317_c0_g2_i1.p1  ORF type:complete len:3830 (+),score=521.16 TRINITY_DN22317_c0_g2_i1:51-11492(+)
MEPAASAAMVRLRLRLLHLLALFLCSVPRAALAVTSGSLAAGGNKPFTGKALPVRGTIGVTLVRSELTMAAPVEHKIITCRNRNICFRVAGDGTEGSSASQLRAPYGIAATSAVDSQYFVADTMNNRIMRWNMGAQKGTEIVPAGELDFPAGIFYDDGRRLLYVADTGNHRIVRYRIDEDGNVVGKYELMAGGNQSGNGTHEFDNPIALYLDVATETFWVADTRNKRIMRFDKGSKNGTVEVATVKGRPYGVYVAFGSIYWSDADDCIVWKRKLSGGAPAIMAGRAPGARCGGADDQLAFPAGIVVGADASLYVADAGNDRAMRWYPNPKPDYYVCTLSDVCRVDYTDGNPIDTNLLVIIKAPKDGQGCGRVCEPAEVIGEAAGTWNTSAPALGTFLKSSHFIFGTPTKGTLGRYQLCWGHAGSRAAFEKGDCSSLPYKAGTLELQAKSGGDPTGLANQCVSGALCFVKMNGYALVNTSMLLAHPFKAEAKPNFRCGSTSNFQGWTEQYRMATNENPVLPMTYSQPYIASDNAYTEIEYNMKEGNKGGRYPLCVCTRGTGCNTPKEFTYSAGTMRVRAANSAQRPSCVEGTTCTITLKGIFLLPTDKIFVTIMDQTCGLAWKDSGATASLFGSHNVVTTAVSNVSVPSDDPISSAVFPLGLASTQGRYKICYCPSHDSDTAGNPETGVVRGTLPCTKAPDYLQDAGVVEIRRADESAYSCALTMPCNITVTGVKLSSLDRMLVTEGERKVCGEVYPIPAGSIFTNLYFPLSVGSTSSQTYTFKTDTIPGTYHACYCSDYDAQTNGACGDNVEFFQVAGKVVVRGPVATNTICISQRNCTLQVPGTGLQFSVDRLQLYRVGPTTNLTCPGNVSEAATALLTGQNGTLDQVLAAQFPGRDAVRFPLGMMPTGAYLLCYCADIDAEDADAAACSSSSDLRMYAGTLRVRGPDGGKFFGCVATQSCRIEVPGFDLLNTDHILLAPVNATCGNTTAVSSAYFLPKPTVKTDRNEGSSTLRVFKFTKASNPGRYRVCYCAVADCTETLSFDHDVGVLFVKGLRMEGILYECPLGSSCSYKISGYGLNAQEDAVQFTPRAFGCGGSQVFVQGGKNETEFMNGVFRRTGLFDGRSRYRKGLTTQLFFDVYEQRWIFGTSVNPDVPRIAGWAWALGGAAFTPEDENNTKKWQVWNATAAAWEDAATQVTIAGSAALNVTSEATPFKKVIDSVPDDVLGQPYLLEETFDFGKAEKVGAYQMCFCASAESDDYDKLKCSSDVEYSATVGMVVVHAVRTKERYHCSLDMSCSIRVALLDDYTDKVVHIMLLDSLRYLGIESQCHKLTKFDRARSIVKGGTTGTTARINATAKGTLATFYLGTAGVKGSFEVCACTAYKLAPHLGGGSEPCTRPEEYFEHAGLLTISVIPRLYVDFGEAVPLNLTRGSGLNGTDRVQLVPGSSCALQQRTGPAPGQALGIAPQSADEIEGSWAMYDASNLSRGQYRVCLCTGWDGPDAGDDACDSGDEFYSEVAWLIVNSISANIYTSTVSASVKLRFVTPPPSATSNSSGATSISNDVALASVLMTVLRSAVAESLGQKEAEFSVRVMSISEVKNKSRLLSASANTATFAMVSFEVRWDSLAIDQLEPTGGRNCSFVADVNSGQVSCNKLETLLETGDVTFLQALNKHLGQASMTAVPSVTGGSATSVETAKLAASKPQNPDYSCLRTSTCDVTLDGNVHLTSRDELLILKGGSICGPTVQWTQGTLASNRGASGFSVNPLQVDGASTTEQVFKVGVPVTLGSFALCYCWDNKNLGCDKNEEFYQRAGTLTVYGLPGGAAFVCRMHIECVVTVEGRGLAAWDKLLVTDGWDDGKTCGGANTVYHTGMKQGVNPAGSQGGSETAQVFKTGIPSETGTYRLCYCLSQSSFQMTPSLCDSTSDFFLEVGVLAVRGPLVASNASLICPRTDDGADYPCIHALHGIGLWPGVDAVLFTNNSGAECGVAQQVGPGKLYPNPSYAVATTPLATWPNVSGVSAIAGSRTTNVTWQVNRALAADVYQICWCTAVSARGCSADQDFNYKLGILTVVGAKGDDILYCFDGEPCVLNVSGTALNTSDMVAVIGTAERCGRDKPLNVWLPQNPTSAVEVDPNGTWATYDLGKLIANPRNEPMSFRICYCASYDGDKDGIPCNNNTDFTHSAGFLNTLACSPRPEEQIYVPSVEDVFGSPGFPQVDVHATPLLGCADAAAVTLHADTISGLVPDVVPADGMLTVNFSTLLATRYGRCSPGIAAGLPRTMVLLAAPNLNGYLDFQITGNISAGADGRAVVPLHENHGLWSQARLNNSAKTFSCPAWEVTFVPLACTSMPIVVLGFILHAFLVLPLLAGLTAGRFAAFWVWVSKFREVRVLPMLSRIAQQLNERDTLLEARRVNKLTDRAASLYSRSSVCLALVFLRISIVCVCASLFAHPVSTQAIAGLACGLTTVIAQIMLVSAVGKTPSRVSCFHSVLTACKVHIDLLLFAIARENHCELWTVALSLSILHVLILQFLWPASRLMVAVLFPPDRRWHLEAKDFDAAVLLIQKDKKSCMTRFCWWLGAWWRSERRHALPSEKRRRRLAAVATFFEASGFHMVDSVAHAAAEVNGGTDVKHIELHWTAIRYCLGGLDLTAMHLLVLGLYWARLTWPLVFTLAGAALLGLLQASRFHLARTFVELVMRMLGGHRWVRYARIVGFVLLATLFRCLLMFSMLPFAGLCHQYPWPMMFWFSSVVFVWFPVLVLESRIRANLEKRRERENKGLVQEGDDSATSIATKGRPGGGASRDPAGKLASHNELFSALKQIGSAADQFGTMAVGQVSATAAELRTAAKLLRPVTADTWKADLARLDADPLMAAMADFQRLFLAHMDVYRLKDAELLQTEGQKLQHARLGDHCEFSAQLQQLLVDLVARKQFWGRAKLLERFKAGIDQLLVDLPPLMPTKQPRPVTPEGSAKSTRVQDKFGGSFKQDWVPPEKKKAVKSLLPPPGTAPPKRLEVDPDIIASSLVALDALRVVQKKAESELRDATLTATVVDAFKSSCFLKATAKDKINLLSQAMPDLPAINLLHWTHLAGEQLLPAYGDEERVQTASSAFEQYGDKVAIIAVIHRWRRRNHPDPKRITSRQLLAFAQWYRERWGHDFEIYFWIDYCCAPDVSAGGRVDEVLPLVYMVSNEVVMCESRDMDDRAWARMELSLAHVFSPSGRVVYALDRSMLFSLALGAASRLAPQVLPPHKAFRRSVMEPDHPDEAVLPEPLALTNGPSSPASRTALALQRPAQLQLTDEPTAETVSTLAPLDAVSPGGRTPTSGVRFLSPMRGGQSPSALSNSTMGSYGLLMEESEARREERLEPGDIEMILRRRVLRYPLHVDAGLRNPERDRSRLAHLLILCRSVDPSALSGDFYRVPLVYGKTEILMLRLVVGGVSRAARSHPGEKDENFPEDENSSSGEDEPPIHRVERGIKAVPTKDGVRLAHDDKAHKWEEDQMKSYMGHQESSQPLAELAAQRGLQEKLALRDAAARPAAIRDAALSLRVAAANVQDEAEAHPDAEDDDCMPLEPWPRAERFHSEFLAKGVRLISGCRAVEQKPSGAAMLQAGGVAVTELPLELHVGVAPQRPMAHGVAFELQLLQSDIFREGGLAVGFTAQCPDEKGNNANPRRASNMAKTWVCGYDGRWFFERRAVPLEPILRDEDPWNSHDLEIGDVITVVLAGPPVNRFRILVNGQLVAETTRKESRMPDPQGTKLWGVVDVNGSCQCIALCKDTQEHTGKDDLFANATASAWNQLSAASLPPVPALCDSS